MDKRTRAVIVVTCDDVNDYFLVINLETGEELKRTSTEQMGTWRWNDGYDEDEMVAKVAASCNIEDYTVIRWY